MADAPLQTEIPYNTWTWQQPQTSSFSWACLLVLFTLHLYTCVVAHGAFFMYLEAAYPKPNLPGYLPIGNHTCPFLNGSL
jgi:hypothetical protein